eukprot:TRINITY_DN4829_c0_g1_i9.p1 TRINITY_DN4829_c0_g1~~TRINITY_DN4829_c0_g1_i9.p1  ORF type:complete len:135 (+),score=13.75 TRINITY_DN4829_c0_g1_i9:170-574(+)
MMFSVSRCRTGCRRSSNILQFLVLLGVLENRFKEEIHIIPCSLVHVFFLTPNNFSLRIQIHLITNRTKRKGSEFFYSDDGNIPDLPLCPFLKKIIKNLPRTEDESTDGSLRDQGLGHLRNNPLYSSIYGARTLR